MTKKNMRRIANKRKKQRKWPKQLAGFTRTVGIRMARMTVFAYGYLRGHRGRALAIAHRAAVTWAVAWRNIDWTRLQMILKKTVSTVDPRVVRLETPWFHFLHSVGITVLFIGIGAFAIAATGKTNGTQPIEEPRETNPIESDPSEAPKEPQPRDTTTSQNIKKKSAPNHTAKKVRKRQTPRAKPHNFYDPVYIFTEVPATSVRAYPLANPPGIAVNISGMPEPDAAPLDMVGKDDRITHVKRRVTPGGIRYILRTSISIQRIDTNHEGNVIIIHPVS